MPSFDVVSNVDMQEVDNAVNQVKKELLTRYDFKGSKSEVTLEKDSINLLADDSLKLKAINEMLNQKMSKRGISPKSLDYKEPEKASGDTIRQKVEIKQGISTEEGKKIIKLIKELNIKKVQGQIQDEQVRVSGPKRDDLQAVIQMLKEKVTTLDLQFLNFRD
jgi:cyclic-di-GMP-binding protein